MTMQNMTLEQHEIFMWFVRDFKKYIEEQEMKDVHSIDLLQETTSGTLPMHAMPSAGVVERESISGSPNCDAGLERQMDRRQPAYQLDAYQCEPSA